MFKDQQFHLMGKKLCWRAKIEDEENKIYFKKKLQKEKKQERRPGEVSAD